MSIFTRNKILYGWLPLLLTLLLYFFWQPISTSAVEWALQAYAKRYLKSNFYAKAIRWHEGSLLIEDFQLQSKRPLAKGGYSVSAASIAIDSAIAWRDRFIAIDLKVEQPIFAFSKKSAGVLETLLYSSGAHFLSIKPHIAMRNGQLKYTEQRIIPFALAFAVDDAATVHFDLQLDGGTGDDNRLHGEIVPLDLESQRATLSFHNVDGAMLFSTLALFDRKVSRYDFEQGLINGAIAFEKQGHTLTFSQGSIAIANLAIADLAQKMRLESSICACQLIPTTAGSGDLELSFAFEGSTAIGIEGHPLTPIAFSEIEGGISLRQHHALTAFLGGRCGYGNGDGQFNLTIKSAPALPLGSELEWQFAIDKGDAGKLSFSSAEGGWAIDAVDLGPTEWTLLKPFFSPYWRELAGIEIDRGKVDLKASGGECKHIHIEAISLRQLHGHAPELNMEIAIGELSGFGVFELLNGSRLNAIDGSMILEDTQVVLAEETWQVDKLQGAFAQGFLKGKAALEYGGLQGDLDIDWSSESEAILLQLIGLPNQGLLSKLPAELRLQTERILTGNNLKITAAIERLSTGLIARGAATLLDGSSHPQTVHFGLEFKPGRKLLGGWADIDLKKGWFSTHGVSLERLMAVFFLENSPFSLEGIASVRGTFEPHNLSIDYQVEELLLQNNSLAIAIPKKVSCTGSHAFDLQKGTHHGRLWLNRGEYLEKNSGLLFTDVSTLLLFENNLLHATALTTCCEGLAFDGAIDVDFGRNDPGFFNVDIALNRAEGPLSSACRMLDHFKMPPGDLQFPIDGKFTLNSSSKLSMLFAPDNFDWQVQLFGQVTEGTIAFAPGDAVAQLNVDFEYDSRQQSVALHNISGQLSSAILPDGHPYTISQSYLQINDLARAYAEFDIQLLADGDSLLRMVGHTRAVYSSTGERHLEVVFDPAKTSVMGATPSGMTLQLSDTFDLRQAALAIDFEVDTIKKFLHRIRQSPYFAASNAAQSAVAMLIGAEGLFHLDLSYGDGSLGYRVQSDGMTVAGDHYDHCVLNGKYKEQLWTIEQLQLDQLSLAADIAVSSGKWVFTFLGVRWEDALLAGLEGEFLLEEGFFDGRVNLLELDFNKLDQLPMMASFIEAYSPKGSFKGSGVVTCRQTAQGAGWHTDLQLEGSMVDLELKEFLFEKIDKLLCSYRSDRGDIVLSGISTVLKSSSDPASQADMQIAELIYRPEGEQLDIQGMAFELPARSLGWFANALRYCFPQIVTLELAQVVRDSKGNGSLKGILDFQQSIAGHTLALRLPAGTYRFLNRDFDLDALTLSHCPAGIEIAVQSRFRNVPVWLICSSELPTLASGKMVISEYPPESWRKTSGSGQLHLEWEDDLLYGFTIRRAYGSFCGLAVNWICHRDKTLAPHWLAVSGEVAVDMPRACKLLPPQMRAGVQAWALGRGYSLNGRWFFNKDTNTNVEPAYSFQGQLQGSNIELKGYQFQSLQAKLSCTPATIDIADFLLEDPAGSLQINKLHAGNVAGSDLWQLNADLLTIHEFRPCLLQEGPLYAPTVITPLVIREIEVGKLMGVMGIPESFTGEGVLHFTNKAKRAFFHPLLAIPSEILNRMGLDLSAMTPVSGTVLFNLRDGKFALTKFKEMYSDGKLSKFFLIGGSDSYVDFDGNLHMQVGMKQYNLLFKLAELFHVDVGGTLAKPTYALRKQLRKNPSWVQRKAKRYK